MPDLRVTPLMDYYSNILKRLFKCMILDLEILLADFIINLGVLGKIIIAQGCNRND